jgi:demethylmenaquinone methyltransferase/2-methoxy-6-polyprenyl-1,4-benzoquinol methylase
MFASDKKLPVAGGAEKRAYVRGMFTAIAPTYDRLNRIISLSLDRHWRRRAVGRLDWEREPEGIYLDLCAGTLDFAAALATAPGFRGRIVAADFVPRMLQLGRGKAAAVAPVAADALALPFAGATFDGVMIGWGVRNLVDLDDGLLEAARVLRAGARLVVLETSTPPHQPMRALNRLYCERLMPALGRAISGHESAYTWLPESARAFPDANAFAGRLRAAGFENVEYEHLMGGVCALHVGTLAATIPCAVPGARDGAG